VQTLNRYFGLNGAVVIVADCIPKGAGIDSWEMLGICHLRKRGLRTLVCLTNLGKEANQEICRIVSIFGGLCQRFESKSIKLSMTKPLSKNYIYTLANLSVYTFEIDKRLMKFSSNIIRNVRPHGMNPSK
jgi:hypothetical protein